MTSDIETGTQRLDLWLWSARFFRTRSLAAEAIDRGRVEVNGQAAKRSKAVREGDLIALRRPSEPLPVRMQVLALARTRGSAVLAQALYRESAESLVARAAHREATRLAPEPAASHLRGRPTKRDRRELGQAGERWQRWSASVDDEP